MKLGLSRGSLSNFRFYPGIIRSRYIPESYKSKIFTLIDFDTDEEFDCITPTTLFLHLGLPVDRKECSIINDLRADRCSLGSVANRVFRLKGSILHRPVTKNLKNYSVKCKEIFKKQDIERKFIRNQRRRLIASLKRKGSFKCKPSLDLIGCSVSELREHLENLFVEGMSWDNYGYDGWHIDHIIPISSFDLSDPAQQEKCFHYTNLQPLWKKDNFAKGEKIL